MRRQTPIPVAVRRVPLYLLRTLVALSLLSLSFSMSAGCWGGTVRSVKADRTLVLVNERVTLSVTFQEQAISTPHRCSWSVMDAVTGKPSDGASAEGDDKGGSFSAQKPGTYLVRADCGSESERDTVQITAFAPTVSMSIGETRPLPFRCFDPTLTPRGRLVCASDGVHVFDPVTGRWLAQAPRLVPSERGLDAQNELVVSASGGCRKPGPDCADDEKGFYLDRLGADDRLVQLSHLPEAADRIPFLFGDELYISGTDRIERYSIKDPTRPTLTGCVASLKLTTVPFMLQDRLAALTAEGQLMVFDPSALPPKCGPAVTPLSVLSFVGEPIGTDETPRQRPLVSAGLIYMSSRGGLITIDAQDPVRPRVTARLPWSTHAVAFGEGKLFALMAGGVIALDLADPRSPRPVGKLDLDGYPIGSRLLLLQNQMWLIRGEALERIDVR